MRNRNLKNIALITTILLSGILTSTPTVFAQETVSIEAAQRGNPYINFTDGKIISGDAGNLSGVTKALAAASADFDRDGVPDLAIAYRTENGGLISIQRGNVESIFPPGADAQPAPFLAETQVFDLPFAPDYLAAGDFNADGKQDLLAAKIGASNLVLRAGTGDGSFAAPNSIELGGKLSAFAVGEMNNFDNLADVAVGITQKNESKVLIFQSRNGAFSTKPETVRVKKAVSALVFGELDAHASHDLIAASGDALVFVSGSVGGKIENKNVSRRKVDFEIKALAIGDFVEERENEIAVLAKNGELKVWNSDFSRLLSTVQTPTEAAAQNFLLVAKVSTRTKADLIIGGANKLNLVTSDGADNLSLAATFGATENPIAVLPMRLNKDALNDLVVLTENKLEPTILMTAPMQILTVSNAGNSGANTLRGAIESANNSAGLDEIRFALPNANTPIAPSSLLPAVVEAATLDATTQPGYVGQPIVALRGNTALQIFGGNSVVRGMVINSTTIFNSAVDIDSAGNVFVEGSYIGTNSDGVSSGNSQTTGVFINESSGNTIGGSVVAARNIVSGLIGNNGIVVQGAGAGGNRIKGNYIGTDKTGLANLGNAANGVLLETAASGNVIGGAIDGERNVISGNSQNGIKISLAANAFSNAVIENNFIGTNKDGDAALGNLNGGVRVEYNASVAPTATAQVLDNVISGNTGDGVYAGNNAAALGLNASPQTANSYLWVGSRSSGNVAPQIGIIGLIISSRSSGNVAPGVAPSGNRIGTNLAGTAALPNTGNGVRLNKIAALIERSTISGNGASGISITDQGGLTRSEIADNFIGTNASGTAAIGNGNSGIKNEMYCEATSETQTTKIYDNVISGNTGDGVFASVTANCTGNNSSPQPGVLFFVDIARRPPTNLNGAANTSPTVSLGNRIGVNAAGTAALPNTGNGVNLQNATAKIEGNIISANGASGVKVKTPASTTLLNQIADNFIGTDLSGNVDLGNAADGISFEFGAVAQNQAISKIWDNVISGNNGDGIRAFSNASLNGGNAVPQAGAAFLVDIAARRNNLSRGNAVPQAGVAFFVDIAARRNNFNRDSAVPQASVGFFVDIAARRNNLNAAYAVAPTGNRIGTNATGTLALGNSGHGVSISGVRTNTEGNTIAHNGGNGVNLANIGDQTARTGNRFINNTMFSNIGIGIDLGGDGPTQNDPGDGDSGPNNLQNFPVVSAVQANGANLNLSGSFNSTPNKPFTLHLYSSDACDASNYGEGKNYLGSAVVTTNAQGNALINSSFAAPLAGNRFVMATATDEEGSTSEFSQCRQFVASAARRAPFDFDGDGKTDIAIFRPASAEWWINRSSTGQTFAAQFGAGSDKIAPGDYTGDGKTDIAIWRPSNGFWFVLRSEDFSFYSFPFGSNGDIPAPSDYDGDGKTDAAVFRPSTVTWYVSKSTGGTLIQQFGQAGDVPAVADYDGDAQADIAIFRPNAANGAEWWIQRSSNNQVFATQFGASTDKAVQGDYTGDGKTDIAIWRPSTGFWFVLRSEDFSFYSFPFGTSGDVPSPGDYDGDGTTDAAVFRPGGSTWYAQRSTAGTLIQQFGQAGDKAVPNAFVP